MPASSTRSCDDRREGDEDATFPPAGDATVIAGLLLQAAAVAGPVLPAPRSVLPRECPRARPGDTDVVVCGRGQEQFRLRATPERYSSDPEALPKASTTIGDNTVSAETEQGDVGGIPTNRIMLRLKRPF